MFKQLKDQDKTSRLNQISGQYTEGVNLYKAFVEALHTQDKARTPRLAIRLDSWHNSLKGAQKEEFAALLVYLGLIPADSPLGQAIKVFSARFKEKFNAFIMIR